jgi:hypothetical protein
VSAFHPLVQLTRNAMVLERTRGGDREVGSGQMNTHEKMKMTRVNGQGRATPNLPCHFLEQKQVVALPASSMVKGDID